MANSIGAIGTYSNLCIIAMRNAYFYIVYCTHSVIVIRNIHIYYLFATVGKQLRLY